MFKHIFDYNIENELFNLMLYTYTVYNIYTHMTKTIFKYIYFKTS